MSRIARIFKKILWLATCWLYCTKWKTSGGKGDFGLSLFLILRLASLEAKI